MKFRYLLPAPFLALLLLGGPASPASAQTLPPFSLTTSAHVDLYASLGQQVTAEWFVEDSGADPLAITMSLAELTALAQQSPAIGWVEPISPSQFTLSSEQPVEVLVVVDVPSGTAPGNYAVNVEALASVPGCSGVCVSGAVAGTLEVHVSGS